MAHRIIARGLVLALIAGDGQAGTPAGPRVKIESGVLEGVTSATDRGVVAFKGIPYATSPEGARRWKAPQPVAPWTGVRAAIEMGPACPQTDRDSANFRRLTLALGGDPAWVPPLGVTSEDCLSLNVFTAALGAKKPRAVMVWLHGGANRTGSGKDQAAALVPHGVVVVTLNYRLGLLGFLAHPALRRESPHASAGSYALLDQIEALRWVQRNIGAFGGDPKRVTVFGHSAGGASVALLLASPLARGLFHRAIIQSGGLGSARPRAEMEAEGLGIARQLEVPPHDPLPALRALPVERLLAAADGPFDATADGWVVPGPGPGALAAGSGRSLPLLIGATASEASVFALPQDLAAYTAMVEETGPAAVRERVLALYPAKSDEEARAAMVRLMTDRDFGCPALHIAAHRDGPTWLYAFTAAPTTGSARATLGAFHGADVRLLFDLTWGRPQSVVETKVGDAMRRYWARFAMSGAPNAPGLAHWPRYQARSPRALVLGDPIHAAAVDPAACAVFEEAWNARYP